MFLPDSPKPGEIWSSGIVTLPPPVEIVLPANLVGLAAELAGLAGHLEFLIFLKGTWNKGRLLVQDWHVPRQACAACTVEALEEPPPGFTGALHRHPPGVTSFSATDRRWLNANLAFSLLFVPPRSFPAAEVYLPLGEEARLAVAAKAVEGPALSEARRILDRLEATGFAPQPREYINNSARPGNALRRGG